MMSKNIFWPAFSDAAMSLRPGTISQIVETPDGFHIMKKSEYSGQFGDYSSYSEEYEELADASLVEDEEEAANEE